MTYVRIPLGEFVGLDLIAAMDVTQTVKAAPSTYDDPGYGAEFEIDIPSIQLFECLPLGDRELDCPLWMREVIADYVTSEETDRLEDACNRD